MGNTQNTDHTDQMTKKKWIEMINTENKMAVKLLELEIPNGDI